MNSQRANYLAKQVAKRLVGRKENYPKALSSLGAPYRVRSIVQGMNLHIYVGDALLTIWVQNFELFGPFLSLALAVNEPERASALVNQADVGLNLPVFVNDYVYCDTELVRRFCQENRQEIQELRLKKGESLCVQRRQIRLRLLTDDVERLLGALGTVSRIFHRYAKSEAGSS